jgi:hypothetical protein
MFHQQIFDSSNLATLPACLYSRGFEARTVFPVIEQKKCGIFGVGSDVVFDPGFSKVYLRT